MGEVTDIDLDLQVKSHTRWFRDTFAKLSRFLSSDWYLMYCPSLATVGAGAGVRVGAGGEGGELGWGVRLRDEGGWWWWWWRRATKRSQQKFPHSTHL